jgi:diguanylate cyclase (GGDEF)-like protein
LLALVSTADYFTQNNYLLEFSAFYLVPISFFSWFIGKRSGFAAGAASLVIGFAIRLQHLPSAVAYWDALVRCVLYYTATFMIVQLKRLYEHEQEASRIDPLTKIANRRAFYEALSRAKSLADRQNTSLSISYLDVDKFKQINDQLGHAAGDKLLSVSAAIIARCLRPSDVAARMGGDEFSVLLPNTSGKDAAQILKRVRLELEQAMQQTDWPVTFSIGIASFSPPLGSVSEMITEADKAMYAAKQRGRNRIEQREVAASSPHCTRPDSLGINGPF